MENDLIFDGKNKISFIDEETNEILYWNGPSLVYREIYSSDYPKENSYDKHETILKPTWSTNTSSLNSIFINPNQPYRSKIYYREVYSEENLENGVQFTIAYGDFSGAGSSTASYDTIPYNVYESKAIYSQYRNTLYETDNDPILFNFDYPDYVGENLSVFKMYGSGTNGYGQLGLFTTNTEYAYSSSLSPNNFSQVSAGGGYTTTIRSDGTLWAIGRNDYGQLGDGTFVSKSTPIQIGALGEWEYVSSGVWHTLAIKKDGSLWAWGINDDGRLGDGTTTDSNIPIKISDDIWTHVSAGQGHSLGIKLDGTLWAWGYNSRGQLGLGDTTSRLYPTQVGYEQNWYRVFTSKNYDGDGYTIGLKNNGSIYGWGRNEVCQLGLGGGEPDKDVPTQISSERWKDIACGAYHTLAIHEDGSLYSWGDGSDGKLADNNNTSHIVPTPALIDSNVGWTSIDCSTDTSVGILDGKLYVSGVNNYGELGTTNNSLPETFYVMTEVLVTDTFNSEFSYSTRIADVSVCDDSATIGDSPDSAHSILSQKIIFDEGAFKSPDHIYAISFDSLNMRDSITPGKWQLSLAGTNSDLTIKTDLIPITLVDDSTLSKNRYNKNDSVYNVYDGSIEFGLSRSSGIPYGLFYPKHGVILLNGNALKTFAGIDTLRTPATSSGAIPFSSNADIMFTAISGAMSIDSSSYAFTAMSTKRLESVNVFVRVLSDDFNFSNNPSYYNASKDNLIKDIVKENEFNFTYITQVGLYNDDNDLLAIAKLSKPIRKTKDTEMIIKVVIRN
jgi:alpha-tubulin suppressor-like RCC1 family protein